MAVGLCHSAHCAALVAAVSACSMSQMMSSASSMPTEMRMRSGGTPAASSASSESCRWVVLAGMDHKRARVADVGEMAAQLQRLDERAVRRPGRRRRRTRTPPRAHRQVPRCAGVVRMVGETGPANPGDGRVAASGRSATARALAR